MQLNKSTVKEKYENIKTSKQILLEPSLKQKTIYIVDDDLDDRFFCEMHLRQSQGVKKVISFSDAVSLFEYFESIGMYFQDEVDKEEHLVLLDLHMPAINGIEVLDYIRSHPVTADMPVMLLTSDVSPDKIYDAYKLEASGYLQKPGSVKEGNHEIGLMDFKKN